jgi:HEAT repeat protein
LRSIDDPRVVPAIAAAALSDRDARVRGTAAAALGRIGSLDCVPVLVDALADTSQDVRHMAANLLGKIGDERATSRLTEVATADPALGASLCALDALAELGDSGAVPLFISLLTETDRHLADGRNKTWFGETTPGLLKAWYERPRKVRRSLQKWSAKRLVELRASEVVTAIDEAARSAGSRRERLILRRTARRLRRAR